MDAWSELLAAAREDHEKKHWPQPVDGCRMCAALAAFPEVPSLFDQIAEPPELSDLDANELGGFRATDPDTSRLAALYNYPRSGNQRHRIFIAAMEQGGNITADECWMRCHLVHQTASTRISELTRGGWLEDSGKSRKSRLGGEQTVWAVTEKGRSEFAQREHVPA